ncbi:hypothetical protein GCM10028801_30550 [Nocardioides maradonensis]
MKGCRECNKRRSQLSQAKGDLARVAHLLARRESPRLMERLARVKADLADVQRHFDEPHECDQLLITDHWTRRATR